MIPGLFYFRLRVSMIPGLFYFPVLSISFELSVYFCIPYSSYRIICVVATSCRDPKAS